MLLLAALIACYLFGPLRFCYVPSGSMEPNLPTWSFCVVNRWRPYETVAEGDIVVYLRMSDGMRIIHRVIAVTDEGLITKGDANRADDGVSVHPANYVGTYLFHIPLLGKAVALAKTRVGRIVMAAVLLSVLLWMAADDRRERTEKAEKSAEPAAPVPGSDRETRERQGP